MRLLFWLALVLAPCAAWDTAPHRSITRAALQSLPTGITERFGAYAAPLVDSYCIYPDRYLEMDRFGFARNDGGPRNASEIRRYCVRPDGVTIHGITGDRQSDRASLVFLFEQIMAALSSNRRDDAAKFAGVLSHFIADSLSPPHAVSAERLQEMAEDYPGNIHSALERSLPEFRLNSREPHAAGTTVLTAAQAVLDACYAGAERNGRDLPAMVKAACSRDDAALDRYRLRAGVRAAEILADALAALDGLQSGKR